MFYTMSNFLRKFLAMILPFFVVMSLSAQAVVTGQTAPEVVKLMGTGWNLGNTLDATGKKDVSSETYWGNPKTTQEMITEVKKAGFNTVRIPVSWGGHASQSGDVRFKIDEQWIARVKEVVDYCYNNKMFVILNIHHDTNKSYYYPTSSYKEQSETFVREIWTQVAAAFADYDQHLIFETLNEPRLVGTDYEWWFDVNNIPASVKEAIEIINDLNQIAVDAIRDNGSDFNKERVIICPGYGASVDGCQNKLFHLPSDKGGAPNRIAVSVHAYAPSALCLGDMSTTKFTSNMKWDIEWHFRTLNELYKSNDIAVVMGETSVSNKNNLSDRLKWVDAFYGYSKSFGIPCVLWDNNAYVNSSNAGEAHGYLNRKGLTWYEDGKAVVDRIMNVLGIRDTMGVGDVEADLEVYVTFADDNMYVNNDDQIVKVTLYGLGGSVVFETNKGGSYNLGYLNKGVYVICVDTQNGRIVRKIMNQ
jgi:aryl-phospho-beta-D-glucosidase BglC (GH1 family)